MAQQYQVTAPYVTLTVKDEAGSDVIVGFYQGAVVENVEAESLKRHLNKGMLKKVSAAEARAESKPSDKK